MENVSNLSIAQRLAIEKQLLREEKFLVLALKTVKDERHAAQLEGIELIGSLGEYLSEAKQKNARRGQQEDPQDTLTQTPADSEGDAMSAAELFPAEESLMDYMNMPSLDNILGNEVELNLTVPSHNCYISDQMPEEEYEEMEIEDDFEIEMGMLMHGDKGH